MVLASRQMAFAGKMQRAAFVVAVSVLAPSAAAAQDQRVGPGNTESIHSGAPTATVRGACQPAQVKYVTSTSGGSSTSQTFVNIPAATLSFTQGGTSPTCIIVTFSALAYAAGSDKLAVRALLNNTTTAEPGEMVLATNDNAANRQAQARAVSFVFPLIEPGIHRLDIQYRSMTGGGVKIGRHSTIAYYAP